MNEIENINKYVIIDMIEKDVKEFQINVINNNSELNYIKIELKEINSSLSIYYNCSNLRKLSESINILNHDEIFKIFCLIIEHIDKCGEYFLDRNSLILDLDYIFIDKSDELKFIYIPYELGKDNNSIIKLYNDLLESKFSEIKKEEIINLIKNEKYKDLIKVCENEFKVRNTIDDSCLNESIKNSIKPYSIKNKTIKFEMIMIGIFMQIILIIIFIFINYYKYLPVIKGSYIYSFILFFIGLMLLSGIMWEYIFKSTNDNNIKFDPEGYLVSSLSEKIIDKKEFIIGRMEEHTDLTIENKAVGKKHAKIEKNNKKFYLFDLDSKNGTFINGNKLEKYKIYEILNNDKITFACCEYQFKIEDKRL